MIAMVSDSLIERVQIDVFRLEWRTMLIYIPRVWKTHILATVKITRGCTLNISYENNGNRILRWSPKIISNQRNSSRGWNQSYQTSLEKGPVRKKITFTIFFWQLDEILTVVASVKLGVGLLSRRSMGKIATRKKIGTRGCNRSLLITEVEDRIGRLP